MKSGCKPANSAGGSSRARPSLGRRARSLPAMRALRALGALGALRALRTLAATPKGASES